ncbi:nuclear pore complex protein Nup214 isoform X2 [Polypterus senegalus]|uniref:nuclear pore complex protein Nup214 isoform X2 n=1 Tax=Polypterus senegalus TaxID=55291 RepID=UPI0019659EFE|nr:nuclear pore complex protein Nup214 isoform X2 [Polypterus senegalus]
MSDDLDAIPEREVKDFQFKQMKKIRIFDTPDEMPKDRCSLLAVSNKYGLTFAGGSNELKVFLTSNIIAVNQKGGDPNEIVVELNCISVPVKTTLHHIALSSDELTLSVCTTSSEAGTVLFFYDVRVFLNKAKLQKSYFASFNPVADSNVVVQDLKWNPAHPSMLAACLSDGSLFVLDVTDNVKMQAQLPPPTGITSVCWSPKGKQVAAGKKDGTLVQYSPALQEKKVIPCPNFYTSDNPVKVLDVLWLSTYVFAVAYAAAADDTLETPPELVVISLPKKEEQRAEKFLNFSDLFFSSCNERQHHFYLNSVDDWDFVLAASAASIEVSIIAKQEDKTNWELWLLGDASRAELPVTESNEDTLPMGVAVDHTSQVPIPISEEKTLPPAPILMLLSTDGVLCPFYLINQIPGAKSFISAPGILDLEGERELQAASSVPLPKVNATPAPKLPVSTFSMPSIALAPPSFASPSVPGETKVLPTGFSFSATAVGATPFALSPAVPKPAVSSTNVDTSLLTLSSAKILAGPTTGLSLSFGNSKPLGENFVTPPSMSSPVTAFKANSEVSTPAPKVNLNDRLSTDKFPLTSTPNPSFGSLINQSLAPPTSTLNRSSATLGSSYPAPPVSGQKPSASIAPSSKSSINSFKPPAPDLEKQLQQGKDSNPIMASIMEEIEQFKNELKDLKERTEKGNFKVGTSDEMKELRKRAEDLHVFILEIKETTESLHGDIGTLKTTMLEGFASAEEAKGRNERNKDHSYQQLLYKKPLDPRSDSQLKKIRQLYQYVKFAVEDVNDVLDSEWEKHLEKKKKLRRLIVPERESLFSTLANHRDIINQERQRLCMVMDSLQKLRLYNKTSQWNSSIAPLNTEQGLDTELESLREALLKSTLETSTKPPSKTPEKLSPAKQNQLRSFLSKRQTPPVRSTAPANLSRSAFLSPKYFEDLDDISSTSSVSQSIDQEELASLEEEKVQVTPPKHQVVSRTPSIQPGGISPPVSVFGKLQVGGNPAILSAKSIGAGGDSTAFVSKTIKHGAPTNEKSPAVTVSAQQAAAAAAMRRQMANQAAAANTSLTESTLKNVPQVVNVKELKEKGSSLIMPPLQSIAAQGSAAPDIQQLSATTTAVQDQPSFPSALKVSVPASSVSLMGSQPGFLFGGVTKPDSTFSAPISSSSSVAGQNKVFSFTSAGSTGVLNFGTLGTTLGPTSQGNGSQGMPKESSQVNKFTLPTTCGKPVFGPGSDTTFTFSVTKSVVPPSATSASSTATTSALITDKGTSQSSKVSSVPLVVKTEPLASKSIGGLLQTTPAGETLGSFSGLRVGQADDEAKATPKVPSTGFSFPQLDKGVATTIPPSECKFESVLQVLKSTDSGSPETVHSSGDTLPPKTSVSAFSGIQPITSGVTTGIFKVTDPSSQITTFGFEQASSTVSSGVPPTTSSAPTIISFSNIINAVSTSPSVGLTDTKPSVTITKPSSSVEPASTPAIEKTVSSVPQNKDSAISLPAIPVTFAVVSTSSTASEKPDILPTEITSAALSTPTVSSVPQVTSITTVTTAVVAEVTSTSTTSQSEQPIAFSSGTVQQQPPSLFGQPVGGEQPGLVFATHSTASPNQSQVPVPPLAASATISSTTASAFTTTTTTTTTSSTDTTTATTSSAVSAFGLSSTTTSSGLGSAFGTSAFSTGTGFGKPTFGQTTAFGQPATSTSNSSSSFGFGQPTFGSNQVFGQPAASTSGSTSSLFGSLSTSSSGNNFPFGIPATSSGGSGLFGQNSLSFNKNSAFGQNTTFFGNNTTTTSSSNFGFGQTSGFGNSSGSSVFGQPSTGSTIFGQQTASAGGGFFSGLGGKPSEDAANKNPFGSTSTSGFGQSNQTGATSLFGNSGAKSFGFGTASFGEQKTTGSFSTGAGSVASQGFGSYSSPSKTGGFGAAPVFGSPPAFGGSPSFGGAPAFGSAPGFNSPLGSTAGKVFGEGTAASSAGGFGAEMQETHVKSKDSFWMKNSGFASASSAPSFGSLANQTPPTFGNLAQPSAGFGGQNSGFGAFGAPPAAFGNSGFGASNQQPTFGSWRS